MDQIWLGLVTVGVILLLLFSFYRTRPFATLEAVARHANQFRLEVTSIPNDTQQTSEGMPQAVLESAVVIASYWKLEVGGDLRECIEFAMRGHRGGGEVHYLNEVVTELMYKGENPREWPELNQDELAASAALRLAVRAVLPRRCLQ